MAMIQVGIVALRSPNGDFLPETPIYRNFPDVDDKEDVDELLPIGDISEIFYEKYKKAKQAVERNMRKK